uniref:Reverse transcriptase domain-containing protein n=1 Tax=Tanacetum cinerariifolium TaxID=118510 RepID=A0A6L2MBK4_TANCI|nr:hypothetical protein [Tanacetum cinerariifolium]
MEQYMSKTRADYGSGITRPKIDDKDHFELNGHFLKEIRDNTFSGSDYEDANKRIEKVLEIVGLFHVPNITHDQEVILLYNGLEVPSRQILDSKGAIQTKTTANAKVAIQEMVEYSQKWHNGTSRTRSTKTFNGLVAIQAQLNNLEREIKKVKEKVYAAQVGYRTVKHPKGFAENVLVWIGKFVFPIDFTILDMPEDVKVPLIFRRPFLSTTHAKIDVFKKKITLRVRDEKIIFKSVKPASSLIKRSLDPLYEDYIKLNNLNVPLELRRDQVDDLMLTIKESEVIDKPMIDIINTRNNESFVVENMDGYRDQDMGDVIFREPFCKTSCVEARRFDGLITMHNSNDNMTYQMARSHSRFKHLPMPNATRSGHY